MSYCYGAGMGGGGEWSREELYDDSEKIATCRYKIEVNIFVPIPDHPYVKGSH